MSDLDFFILGREGAQHIDERNRQLNAKTFALTGRVNSDTSFTVIDADVKAHIWVRINGNQAETKSVLNKKTGADRKENLGVWLIWNADERIYEVDSIASAANQTYVDAALLPHYSAPTTAGDLPIATTAGEDIKPLRVRLVSGLTFAIENGTYIKADGTLGVLDAGPGNTSTPLTLTNTCASGMKAIYVIGLDGSGVAVSYKATDFGITTPPVAQPFATLTAMVAAANAAKTAGTLSVGLFAVVLRFGQAAVTDTRDLVNLRAAAEALGGGAPSTATYITQIPDAGLPNEQALSALATGYMKSATTTGVVTTQAVPIPITDGGTGGITASAARTALGLGTIATQNANAVAITGGTAILSSIVLSGALTNASPFTLSTPISLSTAFFAAIAFNPVITPTGAITSLYGLQFIPQIASGSQAVASLFGMFVRTDTGAAYNGTVSNTYGLFIDQPFKNGGAGIFTNAYGLYVEDQTAGGTLNYAIYTKAGIVRLGGDLAHAGSNVGFYGVTAAARPAAYTQTYATASRTHNNLTATNPPAGGTGATAGAYDTAAHRDAMITSLTNLIADVTNLKQVVNSIIDDDQTLGLKQ